MQHFCGGFLIVARGHIVTVSECSAGLAPGGYSNS